MPLLRKTVDARFLRPFSCETGVDSFAVAFGTRARVYINHANVVAYFKHLRREVAAQGHHSDVEGEARTVLFTRLAHLLWYIQGCDSHGNVPPESTAAWSRFDRAWGELRRRAGINPDADECARLFMAEYRKLRKEVSRGATKQGQHQAQ